MFPPTQYASDLKRSAESSDMGRLTGPQSVNPTDYSFSTLTSPTYDHQGDTVATGWFDMPCRSSSPATTPYDHLPGFGPMGTGILRALRKKPGVAGGEIVRNTAHVTSGPTWSRAARRADRAATRVTRHLMRSGKKLGTRGGGGFAGLRTPSPGNAQILRTACCVLKCPRLLLLCRL